MSQDQRNSVVTVVALRPFFNGADSIVKEGEQVTLPRLLAAELAAAGKVRARMPEEVKSARAGTRRGQAAAIAAGDGAEEGQTEG